LASSSPYKGIAEGVENSNFLVHTGTGYYILTLYEKRVAPGDVPFFLALMEHLAARSITCPQPVKDRSGKALGTLCGGLPPSSPSSTACGCGGRMPGHCAAVGEALARMHLAGADFAGTRRNALSVAGWRPLFEQAAPRADGVQHGMRATIETELTISKRAGRATCRRASSTPTCFPTTCSSWATALRADRLLFRLHRHARLRQSPSA
jgi:homoserine kinase type II